MYMPGQGSKAANITNTENLGNRDKRIRNESKLEIVMEIENSLHR